MSLNSFDGFLSGGVYRAASIEEQPSVQLYRWSIKRTKEGSFFVGDEEWGSGRVSTDIIEFDAQRKRGRTASGRIYELVGEESSPSSNAAYVWSVYKRANKLSDEI